jgi:glycosyltransferase involved in cell wall biosynthesis
MPDFADWRCAFVTLLDPNMPGGYAMYSATVLETLRACVAHVDLRVGDGRLTPQAARRLATDLGQYDLVVFNHYEAARLLLLGRHRRGIYASHNPEYLTERSVAEYVHGWERMARLARATARRRIEGAIVRRASATTCICPEDAEALRTLGSRSIHVVRPAMDEGAVSSPGPHPTSDVLEIGLVGTFHWRAKQANALWLIRRVLAPLARDGLALRLTLAGAGASAVQIEPHEREAVSLQVIESFDDPASVYAQLDLAVVPERQLGGVKLKTLEAARFGLPIVGSFEAFRGTGLAGIVGTACTSPEEYQIAIRDFAARPRRAHIASQEALATLARFTRERAAADLTAVLDAVAALG